MVTLLRMLGIAGVAGGLLWMVIAELVLHESRGGQVRLLLVGGALLLVLSLVVSMAGRVTARAVGRRCPRCGKAVQKGHIYCADHLKEAVNQFRDSQRQKGEGS